MDQKGIAVGIVLLFLFSSVTVMLVSGDRNQTQSSPYEKTVYAFDKDAFDIYRLPEGYPNVSSVLESIEPIEYVGGNQPIQSMSDDGEGDSPWPMYGHDVFHTGRSSYNTTKNMGQNLWSFSTITWVMSSPTISQDGTIYMGASRFYAVNPNGTEKWEIRKCCDTAGVIDDNGIIYFGSSVGWDDRFYALYPNGTIKWSIPTSDVRACPIIADDGTIIFGEGTSHKIVSLYPNGTKKWEYQTNNAIYSSPAVGPDGTVYCGSHDDTIYALYPNGTLKWSFVTGGWVHASPSIGVDGTVYCGSDDGYLYALNPENGSVVWQLPIGMSYASATIGPDGTLYIGVWEKKFYAINPNGTIKWSFDTSPGKVWGSTAALSSDNTLYFGTCDLEWSEGVELIALHTNGTLKWRNPLDTVFSSPAIGCDGTIYIGGGDALGDSCLNAFNEGPLRVEANGPYSTLAKCYVHFDGDVYGGLPPYTYLWDFDDGTTSTEQSPWHVYEHHGNYTATFTVTDAEGNSSSDPAEVSVDYAPPEVSIVKPTNALYIANIKLIPLNISPIIIGRITILVNASQEDGLKITQVNIYIDGSLKAKLTLEPYTWVWKGIAFRGNLEHTISARAYDSKGRFIQTGDHSVWKFF